MPHPQLPSSSQPPVSPASPLRTGPVPEVLAPAGGREQFLAALNSGADAVYLGLPAFNARARATNFSPEELLELVPLAHRYGMKVLITVNVLIKDLELADLIESLSALEALEVDALIVQDLAVARIVQRHFPALRLHASTQMAVHNLAGVLQAAKYGFRRVVLARELTAVEIRKIRAVVPAQVIELEAFCHGSLCYSYSGLCFFSGANDARSGNRGECAYTCRKPYKILNEPGHGFLFSMLDLNTSQDLGMLIDAGVDSLKIEGRKKDAQFVSTSVKLYRQRLDQLFGRPTLRAEAPLEAREGLAGVRDLEDDLRLSFHRGSTGFFLKGRYHENVIDLDNPTHQGVLVGEILRVSGHTVQVRTGVRLERFDGLRIIPSVKAFHARPQHGEKVAGSTRDSMQKYENEHVQFSLREMRVKGARAVTAEAGTVVEIEVPAEDRAGGRGEGRPEGRGEGRAEGRGEGRADGRTGVGPRVGDRLYKTRSDDLRRRVEQILAAPRDYRLRPWRVVDVSVRLAETGETLVLDVRVEKLGQILREASLEVPLQASTGKATLARDLADQLGVFGEAGFLANGVQVEGPTDWFVPRARLKELKHQLAEGLEAAWNARLEARKAEAIAAVVGTSTGLPPARLEDRRFQIKVDRLEYLEFLADFRAAHPDWPVSEVVFEPKRMFLGEVLARGQSGGKGGEDSGWKSGEDSGVPGGGPATLGEVVGGFSRRTGLPVRLAIPTVIRTWDEGPLKRWGLELAKAGTSRLELGNIGAFHLLEAWGLAGPEVDLSGDFTLYALNREASRFWLEQGLGTIALSIEDDLENLRSHLGSWPDRALRPQYILYKDTPLFIAEACSLTALHNGCPTAKVCGYRTLEIESPERERFHVAHEQCKSIVYAEQAFSVTHRQRALLELGVRDFRLDFLTRPYTREAFERVLTAAWHNQALPATHTANLDGRLL